MRRSVVAAVLLFVLSRPLLAQTDTVVGGIVADSSIQAPVIVWTHVGMYGDTVSAGINGWTIFSEFGRPMAPRQRIVGSMELTPLRAHSSNRMYDGGQRIRSLEFHDTSVEMTFGRVDTVGERWISDLRGILIYERVHGTDSRTQDFWSSPYGGIRTRQTYRHITAEDPLRLTFEGNEISAQADVLAGEHVWSRLRLDQRAGRRFDRVRAAESITLFHGSSMDTVSAFLAGGSWPVAGLRPLYGYRYAELRLGRGVGVNGDLDFALRNSLAIAAHVSYLKAPRHIARGVALDLSGAWRGVGLRVGVALPGESGRTRNRAVIYGSILGSSFVR